MDPRGAPEQVLAAHTADEITDVARYPRASISPSSRFPGPEQAEAFAMPADDGFRFNNHHHVTPVGQDPRKDHPQQSICQAQRWPWRGPLDRGELMANRQELQLENRAATEAVAEKRKNGEKDDCIHARDAIQPRSKTPEFLWPMRFLGATGSGGAISGGVYGGNRIISGFFGGAGGCCSGNFSIDGNLISGDRGGDLGPT